MNINYEGNQSGKGTNKGNYKTAEEYVNSSTYIKSHILKQKLIRDGIKSEKCELCGLIMWLNKKIPLELHHVDGNHFNNDIDNLQILCPNCHSIQPGNSGANVGKYNKIRYVKIDGVAGMTKLEDVTELDSVG